MKFILEYNSQDWEGKNRILKDEWINYIKPLVEYYIEDELEIARLSKITNNAQQVKKGGIFWEARINKYDKTDKISLCLYFVDEKNSSTFKDKLKEMEDKIVNDFCKRIERLKYKVDINYIDPNKDKTVFLPGSIYYQLDKYIVNILISI